MKLNRIMTLCAMAAALSLSAGNLFAQDDNGGGNGGGGGGIQNGGGNGGGNGGQGGGGGGGQRRNRQGGGGGNFDPAQMQQRIMDNVKDQLGFTNDDEWAAVQPLVQKVLDARRDVGVGGGMRLLFGRNRGGGGQGGGGGGGRGGFGGFGGAPSPEQEALQNALDQNAPSGQIKDLLAKYKASKKVKQAKLESAQADLKAVLSPKQEAQAYMLELVN